MPAVGVLCAAALLLIGIAGCSATDGLTNGSGVVVGKVYVTGNEPFTKLALQMSDGSRYVLLCTPETDRQLSQAQGKNVKIHFSAIEQAPEGKALRVASMEVLQQ
jgi:hypothetical protein